jgi:diguanylate cyclase (GGDEF)-like protein/PAS domain S-box-containing protein
MDTKQEHEQLLIVNRALRLLSACGEVLIRARSEQQLLADVCQLIVEQGGYLMAWVGTVELDEAKNVHPVAQFGCAAGYLERSRITWADEESGRGPIGCAIRTGKTQINQDFMTNPAMQPWRQAAVENGYQASICLLLQDETMTIGTLSVYSAEPYAFKAEEVKLLEELAGNLAYGMHSLREQARRRQVEQALQMESEKNLTLLRNASDGIHILDSAGNVIDASDAFCTMLGYRRDEMIGMHVSQWEAKFTDAELARSFRQNNTQRGRFQFETRHRRKDGSVFDAEVSGFPLELGGEPVLFYSSRDITERKRAEENLRMLASVFDNTREAILITDADSLILDVNPAFTDITGYSREEVLGRNPKLLASGRQDQAFYAAMWQSLQQKKTWRGEIWNQRKSGEIYAELLSIAAVCDDDGKVLRYVAVFSDISHFKRHEAELNRIAHYDMLTGMPNRVLLADRMKQAIARTDREKNMMAVCYLDLDGFKPINDTMGHDAGDLVLIEVAGRIENTIRGGDTVARLGGDEFVVLLLGLEKGEECVVTLERLLAVIAQPITVKNRPHTISASIGVSIYPLDEEDPDTLLRHADQAMYVAKQSGKNRFYIYDPALDLRARSQHEFLKSIRYGLEHGQFELHYQPKINLRTKQLVGAEALIRWRHPERGLLPPAEFLRSIENTQLDIETGDWVIASALAQISRWHDAGLDIEVSINISTYHLESPRFAEKLGQQLANFPDMAPGKLQIEVLETAALNDLDIVREVIQACREFGVRFALDDFGTGYSSLTYLSSLPVDVLKIDQSFVRDMLEDKGDMAIVHGIIALARAFDRQTVAEGIETAEHYQALLDMGCEVGQGYGIARPMPADRLAGWRAG